MWPGVSPPAWSGAFTLAQVGEGGALRLEAVRNALYGNGTPHSITPAALPCCLLQGNVLEDPLAEPELTPA
jgi:hypothetical protein